MGEKIYRAMGHTGALNITLGIISLAAGISGGVLLIISGANLLKKKKQVMI